MKNSCRKINRSTWVQMRAFYISVCLTPTAASHLSVEANLSVLVTERLNLKVCVCGGVGHDISI